MKAALPLNEEERIQCLRQYQLLDTADEMAYNDLVVLAASICHTPMAYISLVDEDRQWFKARIGIGFRDSDRDLSFCAHAILKPNEIMIVQDTLHDPRFVDNDFVTGKPNIRFYAGVPLVLSNGYALGALAVLDREFRSLTVDQVELLRALARQVVSQFELRLSRIQLREHADLLIQGEHASSAGEKAKQTFLSNISHEFRTPINGIVGLSSLLLDTQLSDRQHEYIEIIERSANELLGVLTNILNYTQYESGEAVLSHRRVDVVGLAAQIEAMMRPMVISKCVDMKVRVDSKLRQPLLGDELRLQQVLTNLVGNALKFTPNGSVDIEVSLVAESQETVTVRFLVRDTGIGIPKDMLNRIFEDFTQVEQGPDRMYGGTGLGLAVSRQITMQMGSALQVESEVGVGSTFWFDVELDRDGIRIAANLNGSESEVILKPEVLLVEDNEVNAMILGTMLEKHGCRVSRVLEGLDAITLVQRKRFDLIFMDVRMPDMDGVRSAKSIRRLSSYLANVPIIAMSASVLHEDEAVCKSAGMNDFVSKPVSEKVISNLLHKWLVRSEKGALL